LSDSREQIIKEMTEYVINVLEEKREEFSGFSVCPFVKADRLADQLHMDIFDNTKDSLVDVIKRFANSGKRSALIAQTNEEIFGNETKSYQEFINILLEETGHGTIAALCFNPKDDVEVEGYNPRSKAPCFLINMAYRKHLRKAHRALKPTDYYDKMPEKYLTYLGVKK
jgi:hypothetical protein